jgi:hypothetical protein
MTSATASPQSMLHAGTREMHAASEQQAAVSRHWLLCVCQDIAKGVSKLRQPRSLAYVTFLLRICNTRSVLRNGCFG